MTTPIKPWETTLQNNAQFLRQIPNNGLPLTSGVGGPPLPPRPQSAMSSSYNSAGYNSYSPYSNLGSSYNTNSYGSMQYRSPVYGGIGGYGGYNSGYGMGGYGMSSGYGMGGYGVGSGYGMGGGYGPNYGDDAERRFIQFAEENSRNTFANVESIIRAFSSIAMMLDNTFFAMTSSFRAVLSVAENFGRLRSMFGHIWQAVNIFRLFKWLYRKMAGIKVADSTKNVAWNEAAGAAIKGAASEGSSWPTLAFFGAILSAPYLISKLLPKYEDKLDPQKWKSMGIPAKAAFDFASSSSNELSLHTNDEIILAPKSVQEEMKLTNSGWAYGTCNGRAGVVPLNYIVIMKKVANAAAAPPIEDLRIPSMPKPYVHKPQKRVSFGENQIIEDREHILNKVTEIDQMDSKILQIDQTSPTSIKNTEIESIPIIDTSNIVPSQILDKSDNEIHIENECLESSHINIPENTENNADTTNISNASS